MKDVFKTAKGKYVAPVPIEGLLGQEPIIEQLCVIGYGMPQPVALVQLAESAMKGSQSGQRPAGGCPQPGQRAAGVPCQNSRHPGGEEPLEHRERVLTPTMKIRRHLLEQKYADLGDAWSSSQSIIWES
jgi:long-chain acyl-CoA synthetase